jgi:acyl-coenzyme A synthetase/AMP-(fatty) acid ligase/SAM-dependent methyltransferase
MEKKGWKVLPGQFISYPYINQLHFADKRDLLLPEVPGEELETIFSYLSRNRLKYQQFLRQKSRHPSPDLYACFQPFNECFKALYPFVAYLKDQLRPGDAVLNLWDRSGWTASMLAGWFPEQEIVTVWEGDKDILGYKGFDYWMSPERRSRHTIVFTDFLRPLPFESKSFAAVIGMDLLHRFNQPELLAEIHRVARPAAPVIFPHVHLTNNLPDPFFERGCRQLHGKDYAHMFQGLEAETGRSGFVLSEPATFRWNDLTVETQKPLLSEPNHTDYNACIAWIDAKSNPCLKPWRGHEKDWEQMYLLQNPLLAVDPIHHIIGYNGTLYGAMIGDLLERHAVYADRIGPVIGKNVAGDTEELLYWAMKGLTLGDIRRMLSVSSARMQKILEELWRLELAQVVPTDETGFRLQTLLGQQQYIPEKTEQNLDTFWSQAVAAHGASTWINSGEDSLTYEQGNELVLLIRQAFRLEGLVRGDKLLICAELHPEIMLIFWAAVGMGLVVVPVSPKDAPQKIKNYASWMQPAFAFTSPDLFQTLKESGSFRVVMIDQVNEPDYDPSNSFDGWLSAGMEGGAGYGGHPEPEDIAVILPTTGTTGNPKAIPISHTQLIRSGRIMTETYHWKKGDRYFGLGGMESMSGLRHATVCVAEVGATCILPEKGNDIYQHFRVILETNVTILAANPLFFKQLLFVAGSSSAASPFTLPVRVALSTGNQLPTDLKNKWRRHAGSALLNYYGLTETSGICIAEPPDFESVHERSIGIPVDCLVKILDESGNEQPVGAEGELCIYGAGVFHGYHQNRKASEQSLKNGWFLTGDLAVRQEDGSISLCGRKTDIVKLPSGERIDVAAIEELLSGMSGLTDWCVCPVRENEKESIALFTVAEERNQSGIILQKIKKTILEKIGAYAVPKRIEFVERIPRGNHNKVLRKELLDGHFQFLNLLS